MTRSSNNQLGATRLLYSAALLLALWSPTQRALAGPLGTEFTYQGRLADAGVLVNGTIDLRFELVDAEIGGSVVAPTQFVHDVPVVDGVFTVQLDFGTTAFGGDARWMAIGVRPGADCCSDPYETLAPRQNVAATPYAQTAVSALTAEAVLGLDGHSLDASDGSPLDALYVNSSGNVGIGTFSPVNRLHVAKGLDPQVSFENFGNSSAARSASLHLRHANGVGAQITGTRAAGDLDGMNLRLYTQPVGGTVTERVRITSDGMLGIGTTTPSSLLSFRNANERKVTFWDDPSRGFFGVDQTAPGGLRHWVGTSGALEIGHSLQDGSFRRRMWAGTNGHGGQFSFYENNGGSRGTMYVRGSGDGTVDIYGSNGSLNVALRGSDSDPSVGSIAVCNENGEGRATTFVNNEDAGWIRLLGANGNLNVELANRIGTANHGWVGVNDENGAAKAGMYVEADGDGRIFTGVLQITGGSDLAEPFDVASDRTIQPGMVVAIDPHEAGKLQLASESYDRKVAGIISGAGGVNPGLLMSQEGSIANGEHPIALTGRVYCWVDADAGGSVQPGDLLTTSDTPGHAMCVRDHQRATGAILGKAMSSLESGRGLVLVLVSLQ